MAATNSIATCRTGKNPAGWLASVTDLSPSHKRLIERALRVLEASAVYRTEFLNTPEKVRALLRLRLSGLEHEEFWIVWLDSQNHLIECERMFRGTLQQTSVYPREVLKSALRHNAGACIFAHNHPSGCPEPSAADQMLTENLKTSLELIDVKTLDHFIVGSGSAVSFSERGLI